MTTSSNSLPTCLALAIATLFSFASGATAQDVIAKPTATQGDDLFGANPLPRGPIHEAFARTLQLTPVPAPVSPKMPPAAVAETPNDNRPSGENVEWIDGYWVYDDAVEKFLWVSGLWRRVPPGRKWEPNRWQQADDGFLRIPGTWVDVEQPNSALAKLDEIPKSLEVGPGSPKPKADAFWVPGNWEKEDDLDADRMAKVEKPEKKGDYVWSPGMWTQAKDNWVWVPDHYVWSSSGARRVSGYWDFPWTLRGNPNACCAEPTSKYSPKPLAIGDQFTNLWTDARTGTYFYGDYAKEDRDNLLPWHQYHAQNKGYDPLCCYYDVVMSPRVGGSFSQYLDSRYAANGYRARPLAKVAGPAVVAGAAAAVIGSGSSGAGAAVSSAASNAASSAAGAATNSATTAASNGASNGASSATSNAGSSAGQTAGQVSKNPVTATEPPANGAQGAADTAGTAANDAASAAGDAVQQAADAAGGGDAAGGEGAEAKDAAKEADSDSTGDAAGGAAEASGDDDAARGGDDSAAGGTPPAGGGDAAAGGD